MKTLLNTTKVLQFLLCFSFLTISTYSNSQVIVEEKPTLESVNQKITAIQSKIESIDFRIAQLQNSNDASQDLYIASLQNSKSDLKNELTRLERIKVSVEYAEQNNLVQDKQSGQSTPHVYIPTQKVKITQANFNALPEDKKEAVLAHPEQYEIIN